ncbi:MAG: succinylglutamate desuccinylase/aspartoacylase family protein [Candidatus Magasanikbacteria bacterium]
MTPKHIQHTLQTLPSGDDLTIDCYEFEFANNGPRIYIHSNLHGSEIIGTVILKEVISYLEENPYEQGKIKIIPCANPIALIDKSYNGIQGRFSPITGTNWNRIFELDKDKYQNIKEAREYFKEQLEQNLPVEEKLAYMLKLLSCGADYLVDIHTSGMESVPYLFTNSQNHEIFSNLEANIHIETEERGIKRSFENYQNENYDDIKDVHACTWEVGTHNVIDEDLVETRKKQLIDFLDYVFGESEVKKHDPDQMVAKEKLKDIKAPYGGYYVWKYDGGEKIEAGDCFIKVYRPDSSNPKKIIAEQDMLLLNKNSGQACSEGEKIGEKILLD